MKYDRHVRREPRVLDLTLHPAVDAPVEIVYGIVCWQMFGGSWALRAAILILNALDLPFMSAKSDAAEQIARQPAILTTVVLGADRGELDCHLGSGAASWRTAGTSALMNRLRFVLLSPVLVIAGIHAAARIADARSWGLLLFQPKEPSGWPIWL